MRILLDEPKMFGEKIFDKCLGSSSSINFATVIITSERSLERKAIANVFMASLVPEDGNFLA